MKVDMEIGHVICADKLHNLKSIIEDKKMIGHYIWSRFNRGAEKQEWYYKGIIESFKMNETMKDSRILHDLSMTVKELFA